MNRGSEARSSRPMARQTRSQMLCVLAARVDVLPVARPEGRARRHVGHAVPGPAVHGPELIVLDGVEIEQAEDRLVQREIDHLALATGRVAMVQRRHDREGAEDAGDQVSHRIARRHRRAVRLADQIGEAAHRLGGAAEPRPVAIRAGLAEAGNAQQDQARVGALELVVAQAPALEGARAIVLRHHVRRAREPLEQLRSLRLGQIQGDAALVARHHLPPQRDAILDRLELALAVALPGVLDLDDVGAEVRQQGRGERHRDHVAGVDHAKAGERLVVAAPGERKPRVDLSHRAIPRRGRLVSARCAPASAPSRPCATWRCRCPSSRRSPPA